MTALQGLRIVETAHRVVGEYCGRLLADFGAEVIKVEPPEGAPTRRLGPFVKGESALFAYLNTNKKSVILDIATAGGRAGLQRLLGSADALIDDRDEAAAAAAGLAPQAIAAAWPGLVHCAITPFGQGAPSDLAHARPLNVMNASGWAWHTPSEADPEKPPLKGAGRFQSDYEAGLDAALVCAASLWRRRKTGRGQFIDISEVKALLSRADGVLGRILAGEADAGPERTRYDMGGPAAAYPCKDGQVFIVLLTKAHWAGLVELMGAPAWTKDFRADWLEFHCTPERVAEFRRRFRPWIAGEEKDAVAERAQKLNVPMVAVNTAADLARNPQYAHRGYFQSLVHPALGEARYPTVPYRMGASPVTLAAPAPKLGQHTEETR